MKFTKMLTAITEILNKDSDVRMDVCLTSQMAAQIELWTALYENKDSVGGPEGSFQRESGSGRLHRNWPGW